VKDLHCLSARAIWPEKTNDRVKILVNGKVMAAGAAGESESVASTLCYLDPTADKIEVQAFGASEIRGPFLQRVTCHIVGDRHQRLKGGR